MDLGSLNASGLVTSHDAATATLNFSTKLTSDLAHAGILLQILTFKLRKLFHALGTLIACASERAVCSCLTAIEAAQERQEQGDVMSEIGEWPFRNVAN